MAVPTALRAVRPDRADRDRLHPGGRAAGPDGAARVLRGGAVGADRADGRSGAARAAARAGCRHGGQREPARRHHRVDRDRPPGPDRVAHLADGARTGRQPAGARNHGRGARRLCDPSAHHRRRARRSVLQRPRVQLQAGLPVDLRLPRRLRTRAAARRGFPGRLSGARLLQFPPRAARFRRATLSPLVRADRGRSGGHADGDHGGARRRASPTRRTASPAS